MKCNPWINMSIEHQHTVWISAKCIYVMEICTFIQRSLFNFTLNNLYFARKLCPLVAVSEWVHFAERMSLDVSNEMNSFMTKLSKYDSVIRFQFNLVEIMLHYILHDLFVNKEKWTLFCTWMTFANCIIQPNRTEPIRTETSRRFVDFLVYLHNMIDNYIIKIRKKKRITRTTWILSMQSMSQVACTSWASQFRLFRQFKQFNRN